MRFKERSTYCLKRQKWLNFTEITLLNPGLKLISSFSLFDIVKLFQRCTAALRKEWEPHIESIYDNLFMTSTMVNYRIKNREGNFPLRVNLPKHPGLSIVLHLSIKEEKEVIIFNLWKFKLDIFRIRKTQQTFEINCFLFKGYVSL